MEFNQENLYNGLSDGVAELIGASGYFGNSIYDIKRYLKVDGKVSGTTVLPMTLVEIHKEDTFVAENGMRYNFFYMLKKPYENWENIDDIQLVAKCCISQILNSEDSELKDFDSYLIAAFVAGADWARKRKNK